MKKNFIFIVLSVIFNALIFSGCVYAQNYVVFTRPAITNKMILSDTVPSPSEINDTIAIFASPSEYEPATFAIRAYKDLSNVQVSLKTDLIGDNGIIQKNNVDISLVKIWWQQNRNDVGHANPNASKQLVPELLIKNDSLITVDYVNQINILNFNVLPTDSSSLQPVNIQSNTTRQFWITVYVPNDAQPGIYNGTIEISPQNSDIKDLKLSVNVLPIHLERSILDYSMFYRNIINASCNLLPSALKVWCRTPEQYEAELRDMLSHGVDRPTVYEEAQDKGTSLDTTYLTMVLEIRKKVGLGNTPLFTILNNLAFLGVWWIGAPSSTLTKLTSYTGNLKSLAQSYGYTNLYIYPMDEASGSTLTQERPGFQAIHDGGGKVFGAVYSGFFSYIGDLFDLPIMALNNFTELGQVHALGYKMYSYGNPQTGLEQPYIYRNNYGLWLWKQGLDGSCDYVYQDVHGDSGWNDFADAHYKDETMAYSSSNGVIDTIQWEGWREGYDDMRYLSTLLKQINESKKYPNSYSAAIDAENWLNGLNIVYRKYWLPDDPEENDLQGIRWQMAQRIISLKNATRAKVSGKLSDNNGSSLQGVITSFNSGTGNINASAQTNTSGNYNFYLFPDFYDIKYDINNFFIPNFWIKLLSINVTSNIQDLVNYVTGYTSENKVSFTVNITNNQIIQTYSTKKPKKVLINGTNATEVSSLSELTDNTWFYNSSENKLYMNVNSTNQPMMEKTITWADGTNETIKVDSMGRIFLNGSEKIAFGLHIVSRDWKKSSPKQVLDTLQNVTNNKVRFMALDLSSWLNISQCQSWMNTWMDELYKHKMFVLLNIQESPAESLDVDAQAQRFSDIVDLINDSRWANIIFAVGYGGWEIDNANYTDSQVDAYLSQLYPLCRAKVSASNIGFVPLITKCSATISTHGTIPSVKWSDIPSWDFYPFSNPDWKTYIDQRLPVYHEQTMVQASKSGYHIWLNENGYDSNNTQYPPEMLQYLLNGGGYNDTSMILLWCLEWYNDNYEYRAFDTNGNPRQWFLNLVPYLP